MNDKQDNLIASFKKMSLSELKEYESAILSTRRIGNLIGILCVLVMIFNYGLVVLLLGTPIVLLLANITTGLSTSLDALRNIMSTLTKA